MDLPPGVHLISAYAGSSPSNTLTGRFTFRPPEIPTRGPLPSKVTADPGIFQKSMDIPFAKDCNRTDFPQPSVPVIQSYWGKKWVSVNVDWCFPLRFRMLSYHQKISPNGTIHRRTNILSSVLNNLEVPVTYPCTTRHIYAEICSRLPGLRHETCGTSPLKLIKRPRTVLTDYDNGLFPPAVLTVKPGQRPLLKYDLGFTRYLGDEFSDYSSSDYLVQIAAVARDGFFIGASDWSDSNVVETHLPLHGKSGITTKYDGATTFLRFMRRDCAGVIVTENFPRNTKIWVREEKSAIVRQDTQPPVVGKLVYPWTTQNTAVELRIEAKSNGGGLLMDGGVPKLQYQWFVKDILNEYRDAPLTPLKGETGPTLSIAMARCMREGCEESGSSSGDCGYRYITVGVCNSLGCVLSSYVQPVVLRVKDNEMICGGNPNSRLGYIGSEPYI